MAVCKQPPITPETTCAEDEEIATRGETKWKRFHPFRVVRKIFRRRIKRDSEASKKSWSTSELQSVEDDGTGKREVTSLKIGFSVSHDSIFSPESNANAISGEALSIPPGSSLSVHHTAIKDMFKDELFTTVRARRDSGDDAMSQSPCTSPTTTDSHYQGLKEISSQTTYSASSSISMDSSEIHEDPAEQFSSKPSRSSLIDRRSLDSDGDLDVCQSVPLNHKAAHHKIAVRPKRNYGLPRRRKNQIAASKVSTLPSTPEVIEDFGKNFDAIEVVKTFSETHSSEWQTSHLMSSFSYNEMSDLSKESLTQEESSGSSTQILRRGFEDNSRCFSDEITPGISDDLTSKGEDSKIHFSPTESNEAVYTCQNKLSQFSDARSNSFDNHSIDIVTENSITIRDDGLNNTQNISIETNQSSREESVPTLKMSSVVKNFQKKDSFNNSEKIHNVKEDVKSNLNKSINDDTVFTLQKKTDNLTGLNEISTKCDMKDDLVSKNNSEGFNETISSNNLNMKTQCFVENHKEVRTTNVPDIDSEFVLKHLKIDVATTNEPNFKHIAGKKEKPLVSSHLFEEEIRKSSKSLSTSVEENGIYVSHHSSMQTDLKDVMVTEAHNFAAVEENLGVFIQASGDNDSCEPWISSVDIPASGNFDSHVNVNSSTSTLCDSKIKDEKITITVNSKSEKAKSHEKQALPDIKTPTSIPKHDMMQQPTLKDKQPSKTSHNSNSHEMNSNTTSMKNANFQKRVSVEIVPFSQRMKERKYQPISFTNKDSPEQTKISNTVVEKKLSTQKFPASKEAGKSSSQNIFPKSLTCDSKKGESVIEKNIKSDKVQFPVQIRIHKSAPNSDIKDKSLHTITSQKELENPMSKTASNEVKFQMQAAKVSQSDKQLLKDNNLEDNASKWEKQQTFPLCNNTEQSDNSENSLASESSLLTLSESQNPQAESKDETEMHEVSWRPPSLSEDPEPELLRVFARRSIKQKHCDKGKTPEDKERNEENSDISVSPKSTVIQISEAPKPNIAKHELKKKSKSFCEKAPRAVSPLKEINLIPGETLTKLVAESSLETIHPRQRLASVPNVPLPQCTTPPSVKEDTLNLDEPPSWLQLAQQRREMREQRERLLLGGSPNSFMDPSNKPTRSSKVWDMVNNFQKLQMT